VVLVWHKVELKLFVRQGIPDVELVGEDQNAPIGIEDPAFRQTALLGTRARGSVCARHCRAPGRSGRCAGSPHDSARGYHRLA
jgi:hypothetical protein